MQQLEKRFYSRQEIGEILSVNPEDSRHFRRNVAARLQKWKYGFTYAPDGITITQQPETAEDRLSEILIRRLGIDPQIHTVEFACFICAFWDIEGFDSMPWAERERALLREYGYTVCERTLRNWCSRLMACGYISKSSVGVSWKTTDCNGTKIRTPVERDDAEMAEYFKTRRRLIEKKTAEGLKQKLQLQEARNRAWKTAMSELWREYHCCYYYCGSFSLNAIDDMEDGCLYEIYELTEEIVGRVSELPPQPKILKTKEDFDAWF